MKLFNIDMVAVAEMSLVVPTAAGELYMAVMSLGEAVEEIAIATGQNKNQLVTSSLMMARTRAEESRRLLLEKLPKRSAT